jgi:hypothetical protein
MFLMADGMGWPQVISSDVGIILITTEDCPHCTELQAILSEKPLDVPYHWIDKSDAEEIFAIYPHFEAAIDVLPFAGIFSNGEIVSVIRAATPERLKEELEHL